MMLATKRFILKVDLPFDGGNNGPYSWILETWCY
jgi:hypothetical protein